MSLKTAANRGDSGKRRRQANEGREEPRRQSSDSEYEEAFVTYIDILGFSDLIHTRSATEIATILRMVRAVTSTHDLKFDGYILNAFSFSDLTLRTVSLIDGELAKSANLLLLELLTLVRIQANLANRGVLVRGGMCLGHVYPAGARTFGPAVVRAYEIESTVAAMPRIVIDRSLIERAFAALPNKKERDAYDRLLSYALSVDNDEHVYVDYIRGMQAEYADEVKYCAFLKRHRTLIIEGLDRHRKRSRTRLKYHWLLERHNEVVTNLNRAFLKRNGLSREDLQA